MEPERFDWWRRNYADMDARGHAIFYKELHRDHPDQKHYDIVAASSFFDAIPGPISVVELGGYDGALARECLGRFDRIDNWVNYDLDPKGDLDSGRYIAIPLDTQLWERVPSVTPTAFVSSHTIEHLSPEHLVSLLECVYGTPHLYLDVPLHDTKVESWDGKTCAHKLETNWRDLEELVCGFGYTATRLSDSARAFRLFA